MESIIECLVIGAGVVELAAACALARNGWEVIVVENEDHIGAGVSSRNSEVIRAGVYYRTGLLKTRLCVKSKAMSYEFCQDFSVPHKRCGKLLVAANAREVEKLAAIKALAEANGVTDLVWLSGLEARGLEPELTSDRALLSPSTRVIDSHAYMLAFRRRRRPTAPCWRSNRPSFPARLKAGASRSKSAAPPRADRRRNCGECGRPQRPGDRAFDRRHAGRQGAPLTSRQRKTIFPWRPALPSHA